MIARLKETIGSAIAQGNARQLRECFYKLKHLISEGTDLSSEDFDFFARLVEQQKFLDLGGGWYFIMVFQLDRDNLPFRQSEKISSAMSTAYDAAEEIPLEMLVDAIEQAIESGQEMQMQECASAISFATSRFSYFPSEYFELIVRNLQKENFLKSNESWHLLHTFDSGNWYTISDQQKDKLLLLLETAYPAFSDWMSCFFISELLGSRYANEGAFEVFCRLKKIEAEMPRSFVPHGFEHIVTDSSDRQLQQRAHTELLQMKNDPSEEVRGEVKTSLQRIANRKKREMAELDDRIKSEGD
ncbi:MAG: hypothetical protein SW833_00025 [Cyanobacteriota bacterium]|nr:hypothetical protein [Cyanobacteriota bacterium]